MADDILSRIIHSSLSTIEALRELPDALRNQPPTVDPKKLLDVSAALEKIFKGVNSAAEKVKDGVKPDRLEDFKKELEKAIGKDDDNPSDSLKTLRDNLGAAPPQQDKPAISGRESDEETPSLMKFFSGVSTSLIEAQKNLNERSRDYVASLDPLVPPAYFAIPTLKAEVKVGIRESTEKGVNLVLFTKKGQREEYAESAISFEVVAVPPPAVPSFGEYIAPMPGFLVLGAEKMDLLDRIRAEAAKLGKTVGERYKNTEGIAAVLRYPSEETGKIKYLVLWPGHNKKEAVDIWREMLIFSFSITTRDGEQTFEVDLSIFDEEDAPEDEYVWIPGDSELERLAREDAAKLKKLTIQLGDVIQRAMLIIGDWANSYRRQPPAGAQKDPPGADAK